MDLDRWLRMRHDGFRGACSQPASRAADSSLVRHGLLMYSRFLMEGRVLPLTPAGCVRSGSGGSFEAQVVKGLCYGKNRCRHVGRIDSAADQAEQSVEVESRCQP